MNGSKIFTPGCARFNKRFTTGSDKLKEKSMELEKSQLKIIQVKVAL